MKYRNPIISGYNPDPSICRVGEDYYIVNSSFEFFPGVPLYHSTNLVNWELTGYCLTRKSQDPLDGARSSGGIYAPMLCYHDGVFFMTTTNVTGGGHLIVHTDDLNKGWSEPAWVDQDGIDPTLFFEGDDVYFASTSVDENGRQGIFMCRIDPYTGEKLTESVCISYGCGGICPEGPHLYKWFGKYYLLLAEGGTEYGHMVTLQRSDSLYGPYEPCPHGPILTHRDDQAREIACTGHADIMQDHNGNWWLVCLGVRTGSGSSAYTLLHHLGRETFLAPVVWAEDGWPVVGNNGKLALTMDGPLPGGPVKPVCRDFADDFRTEELSPHYNFVRNPEMAHYVRDAQAGTLTLHGTDVTLNDTASPTWIGVRQKEHDVCAETEVSLKNARDGARAGLTAFYNECYHYEIYVTNEEGSTKVCLARHIHDLFAVTASATLPAAEHVQLKIEADRAMYHFYYRTEQEDAYRLLGSGSTAGLATEGTMTMTFTGTYLGMFAERGDGVFRGFRVTIKD